MVKCNYSRGWAGNCTNSRNNTSPYCDAHDGVPCVSCGEQATHECSEETKQFLRDDLIQYVMKEGRGHFNAKNVKEIIDCIFENNK